MGRRGLKHHLKRLAAPSSWVLDKLSGCQAPLPSSGPHKARECLPIMLFLRNKLKYALTYAECKKIVKQNLVSVDGKVRTDMKYPAGFMDVITLTKTNEHFRLLYDVKGRFVVHRIKGQEAQYKLCKVRKVYTGPKGIPYLTTHDGRTIKYPDPLIKMNDTIMWDFGTHKITDFIKFDSGNLCMITGGHNIGRVGFIQQRDKHPGSFEIIHVKDASGNSFATRSHNVFVIGKLNRPFVSLPKGDGIRLTIAEERDQRLAARAALH